MRDVERIKDTRCTRRRDSQWPGFPVGAEPDDGTDNGQRNETLQNIKQGSLKLPQRAEAERYADGGKKRQTAGRSCSQSTDNGTNGTELFEMQFHIVVSCGHAI
jgi:hypothetical protein